MRMDINWYSAYALAGAQQYIEAKYTIPGHQPASQHYMLGTTFKREDDDKGESHHVWLRRDLQPNLAKHAYHRGTELSIKH